METESQTRLSALGMVESQTANTVNHLVHAVDQSYADLETRLQTQLGFSERHSGVQELFGQLQTAGIQVSERLDEVRGRLDSLEASASTQHASQSLEPFAFTLQALQSEVSEVAAMAARAVSLSEGAARCPGGSGDPSPCDSLRADVQKAFGELREELAALSP